MRKVKLLICVLTLFINTINVTSESHVQVGYNAFSSATNYECEVKNTLCFIEYIAIPLYCNSSYRYNSSDIKLTKLAHEKVCVNYITNFVICFTRRIWLLNPPYAIV